MLRIENMRKEKRVKFDSTLPMIDYICHLGDTGEGGSHTSKWFEKTHSRQSGRSGKGDISSINMVGYSDSDFL